MTQELTAAEVSLGDTLTKWLLAEMLWRLPPGSPAPDLLWDGAQSNFELACEALARHGALRAEDGNWRVLSNAQIRSIEVRRDLDRLLDALACHAPYVEELFPFGDPVHPLDPDLVAVCVALEASGYMESDEVKSLWPWGKPRTTWYWAPTFDPWLALHNGLDWDVVTPAPSEQVLAALADIPAKDIAVLSSAMCSAPPAFLRIFFSGWRGAGWCDSPPADAAVPHDGWNVGLAAGLYLHLHGDGTADPKGSGA